ncbi:hypothetical protein [Methanobrevibacter sp.]
MSIDYFHDLTEQPNIQREKIARICVVTTHDCKNYAIFKGHVEQHHQIKKI